MGGRVQGVLLRGGVQELLLGGRGVRREVVAVLALVPGGDKRHDVPALVLAGDDREDVPAALLLAQRQQQAPTVRRRVIHLSDLHQLLHRRLLLRPHSGHHRRQTGQR